jgi:hypothetical protein
MPTKISFVFDQPTDPNAFESAYPAILELAKGLTGVQRAESGKVWPHEDGSPTAKYRVLDLYFADYDSASAATADAKAGEFFPQLFQLGSAGLMPLFIDIEA